MGASESKIAVETPRPDRSCQIRNERVCRLVDPRSPSTGIDRTPIQVGDAAARGSVKVECEGPVLTVGITRTPMKDVMRATVHSFARRLGMLFLNEGGDSAAPLPPFTFSKLQNLHLEEDGELDSTEPLLPPPSLDSDPLSSGACSPPTPACQRDQTCDAEASPTHDLGFQAEEEQRHIDVEIDHILDMDSASGDDDPTLRKELSLSLLTCHEGVVSSQMVSDDAPHLLSPLSNTNPHRESDLEACQSPTPDSVRSSPVKASPSGMQVCSDTNEPQNDKIDTPAKPETIVEDLPDPAATELTPTRNQMPQAEVDQIEVKRPIFNTKSPSQVVFKPQWLGVGFGVAGVRARGVQGKGKGGSSPLSVRSGKNAGNENKGQPAKQKQRDRCGKTLANEGRSPLQVLKERNSPLGNASQMKLKIATPDRQRLGQIDRRALSLSLNKENQR
ncbi:hypothetical protein JZ751_009499 [Albula glossodonta]|uniref:Uncharacterized protein n=1 Tax=Albula glossodonta TaxID=121402 RepID=A0A8T2NXW1_9TELE|nr:hypothetical protein JZ751_009499 [Albula glossodonta]